MLNYNKDILTDEEKLSGYKPGEQDDDVFSLGDEEVFTVDNSYLVQDVDKPEDSGAGEDVSMAEEIEAPDEGSLWDAFDDSTGTDTSESPGDETGMFDEDESGIFEQEEPKESPEPVKPEPEPEKETDLEEFNEEIDDDLRNLIESELSRSKSRKASKKAEEEARDEPEPEFDEEPDEEFQPVDELSDTELIDISEIDVAKPSEMLSGQEPAAGKEAPPKKEDVQEDEAFEDEIDDAREQEEKKKRRRVFWVMLPVAIILVGLISYFGYQKLIKPKLDALNGVENADTSNTEEIAVSDTLHSGEKHGDTTSHDDAADNETDTDTTSPEADNAHADTAGHDETIHGDEQTVNKEEVPAAEKKVEKKSEKKAQPEKKNIPAGPRFTKKDDETVFFSNKKKSKPKKEEITQPEIIEKQDTQKTETKEDNNRLTDSGDIAANKIENEELPAPDSNEIGRIIEEDERGLYTVQVYATPSRKDAEEWLAKLRELDVENAVITEQKIRDVTWYRVRFGNYTTRAEARSAAAKYGFAQTWIDRVK
jgi:hypothetical protein